MAQSGGMTEPTEQTREKRSGVILRATVVRHGDEPAERRVRNLSATGACIEHDGELEPGMALVMAMGAIPLLRAEVMWVRDQLAGVRFDRTVSLDAARRPRGPGKIGAGWMDALRDGYRK